MKITAEQAERLCAHFAAQTPDQSYTIELSEVTLDSEEAYSPERVQAIIRAYVHHKDNV